MTYSPKILSYLYRHIMAHRGWFSPQVFFDRAPLNQASIKKTDSDLFSRPDK